MDKENEAEDYGRIQKPAARSRHHRRRSAESGAEFNSRAFQFQHRRRSSLGAEAQAIGGNDPEQNSNVWDCESTLYDSFELLAFSHRLDRALGDAFGPSPAARFRSLSMPHYAGSQSQSQSPPARDDFVAEIKAGHSDFQTGTGSPNQKRRARLPWLLQKMMKGLFKMSVGCRTL